MGLSLLTIAMGAVSPVPLPFALFVFAAPIFFIWVVGLSCLDEAGRRAARIDPADAADRHGDSVDRANHDRIQGLALLRRGVLRAAHVRRPTITLDVGETEMRRAELRRLVPASKYSVRAGEKIVGAHEVVGREEHEKLQLGGPQPRLAHGNGGVLSSQCTVLFGGPNTI